MYNELNNNSMKTNIEIERKFIVREMPKIIPEMVCHSIEQGYLVIGTQGDEVRLRKKGDAFILTVKGDGTLARKETEIVLNEAQFTALWPMTEGKRIVKKRYEIHSGEHLIELDVFEGELRPLMFAEVEFDSVEASQDFSVPTWFEKEVTDDKRYKNRSLATDGVPK